MVHKVPLPHLPEGMGGTQVAAAAAATLVEAIDNAQAHSGLTLREMRAVTVGAQTASQYIPGLGAAQVNGDNVRRWPPADLAWHSVLDATMALDDGRGPASTPNTPIGQAVIAVQAGLQHGLGPLPLDAPSIRARTDLRQVLQHLRDIAVLLPLLADQLIVANREWAKAGALRRRQEEAQAQATAQSGAPATSDLGPWTAPNLARLGAALELAKAESIAQVDALRIASGSSGDFSTDWPDQVG